MKKYFLGIDCGTTMLKVNLYDEKGIAVMRKQIKNPVITEGRKIEIDMEKLWDNVSYLIREIIKDSKLNPSNIVSIGVCAQGEGLWALDKDLKPVRNAILWNDSRAHTMVDSLHSDRDLIKQIKNITGSFIFGGGTNLLLKYIKENEREVYDNIEHIFFCKDFIRFKLTGEIFTDYSDMSTSIIDLNTKEISNEMLKLLDIEQMKEKFAPMKKSYELGGKITKEAARLTGLKENTPVAIGMLDVISSLSGVGAVNDGDALVIIGTTISCGVVRQDLKDFSANPGYEIHFLDDKFLEVMSTMSGAANLEWAIDTFYSNERREYKDEIYSFLETEIKDIAPGAEGIIFHPYISESGERMPFSNKNARAQFMGLSINKGRKYMLKAVYEGVALAIRDCLDSVFKGDYEYDKDSIIYLTGGGSQSEIWAQIIADATGRSVKVLEGGDFTCRGAAMLSTMTNEADFSKLLNIYENYKVKWEFIPDYENFEIYQDLYYIYKKTRMTNDNLWHDLKLVRDKSKRKRKNI
ncbi:MAG: FGGY-family carbohydrate kinase [Tissierellia bacterium]|nr:FGGY-family carbohydrate kinase [Tissierellia bacterium]